MVRSRVELFEQIRRDRRVEGLSVRELAGRHRVHRRTVRQALASAVPPARKGVSAAVAAGRPGCRGDRRLAARRSGGAVQAAAHGASGLAAAGRRTRCGAGRGDGVAACRASTGRAGPGPGRGRGAADASARRGGGGRRRRVLRHRGRVVDQAVDVRAVVALGQGGPPRVRHPGAGGVPGGARAGLRPLRGGPGPDPLRQPEAGGGPGAARTGPGRVGAVHRAAQPLRFDGFFCILGKQGAHEKGGVEGEIGRFCRRQHLVTSTASSAPPRPCTRGDPRSTGTSPAPEAWTGSR